MKNIIAIAALAGAASASIAGPGDLWDEALMGDLANDINAPTDLGTLALGVNAVTLSVELSNQPEGDLDVFSFTIAAGQELAGLILLDYQSEDALAFLAIADGAVFPTNPNNGDITAFLGGILFGPAVLPVGSDYFSQLRLPAAGGTGFSGNLGPGTYSVFVQQTGLPTTTSLGFVVIPAPSSLALIGLGGLAAVRRRR